MTPPPWLLAAGLLGCEAPPADLDEGFRVVSVSPLDGSDDAYEVTIPELRVAGVADPERCNGASVRIDAVHDDDDTVAFSVPLAVDVSEDGGKLRLVHLDPLPRGFTYAMTARGGPEGCSDVDGDDILPFRSLFTVQDADPDAR
jgi:hypothetical protein